jgi:hypothetical protein
VKKKVQPAEHPVLKLDPEGRALALSVDSLGGYAVPVQLDGKKKRKPKLQKES